MWMEHKVCLLTNAFGSWLQGFYRAYPAKAYFYFLSPTDVAASLKG
jgi:hypothetical protein